MVVSCFGEIDRLKEGVVGHRVLSDGRGLLVNEVSELFLSWPPVSGVELDAEVFLRSARVVASSQQHSSQTVPEHLVALSDVGGTGRGGDDAVQGDVKFADPVGAGYLSDDLDGLV